MSYRSPRFAIAALSCVGIAITSYLLYTRYSGTRIVCPTGGCETVQTSSYSKLAGIPVAALGLAGFAFLLATTFVQSPWARAAALTVSLAAVIFGAYLLVVQLVVIDAVCVWCLTSDCVALLIAIAAIVDARQAGEPAAGARGRASGVVRQT